MNRPAPEMDHRGPLSYGGCALVLALAVILAAVMLRGTLGHAQTVKAIPGGVELTLQRHTTAPPDSTLVVYQMGALTKVRMLKNTVKKDTALFGSTTGAVKVFVTEMKAKTLSATVPAIVAALPQIRQSWAMLSGTPGQAAPRTWVAVADPSVAVWYRGDSLRSVARLVYADGHSTAVTDTMRWQAPSALVRIRLAGRLRDTAYFVAPQ